MRIVSEVEESLLAEMNTSGESIRSVILRKMAEHNKMRQVVPRQDISAQLFIIAEELSGELKAHESIFDRIAQELIAQCLLEFQGNQRRVARFLNFPKSTLNDWIQGWINDSKS